MINPIDIYSVVKYGELFNLKIGSPESDLLDLLTNEAIEIFTVSESDGLKIIIWENIEFHLFDGAILSIIIKIKKSRSNQRFFIGDPNRKINYRSTFEKIIKIFYCSDWMEVPYRTLL